MNRALFLLAFTITCATRAASLTWDADPTNNLPQDGGGTWDAVNTNWWDGVANTNWANATPDSAAFGVTNGAAGPVDLGTNITVGGITFNAPASGNYTIRSNTLTLSGAASIAVDSNATISSILAGSSLTKSGGGMLTLSNSANSFTGGVVISGGTVTVAGALLGTNPTNTALGASGGARSILVGSGCTLRFAEHDQLGNTSSTNQRALIVAGGTVKGVGRVTTLGGIVLAGGIMIADGGVNLGGNAIGTFQLNGSVTVTGSTASAMNDTGAANSRYLLNYTGGATTFNVLDATGTPADDLTISTRIANGWNGTAAGITKTGAGTLSLSGTNTYSGATTVSAGTLLIATNGSIGSAGALNVGGAATGTLTINGGNVTSSLASGNALGIGVAASSPGVVNMLSGTLVLSGANGAFQVGDSSAATYSQSGGTVTVASAAENYHANNVGGTSTIGFGGGSFSQVGANFRLGVRAATTVTITNAAAVSLSNLIFGHPSTSGGSGTINLDGGTLALAGFIKQSGTANVNFNGGIVRARASSATFMTGLNAATVRAGGALIDTTNFNITIGQALVSGGAGNDGGLTKSGTGILTLAGANSYTGATTVSAGTLLVDGTTTNGPVFVASGATLGGAGTIKGAVSSAGTVAPGASAGVLNISNDLTQASTGNLLIEIGGPAVGSGYDQLNVSGTAALDGTLTVVTTNGFSPNGLSFTILKAGLISGGFAATNLPPLATGFTWDVQSSSTSLVITALNLGSTNLVWLPTTSADWDVSTTNWFNPGDAVAGLYEQGDNVLFDDTGAVSNVVKLTTVMTPRELTVNSSSNYTFSGPGSLGGSMGLTKDGAGTLTLLASNSAFVGGTTVSNGTLALGANGALGTGAVALSPGVTLAAAAAVTVSNDVALPLSGAVTLDDRGNPFTLVNGVVGGAGIVKSGTGTVTLTGPNAYTGPTTISGGTLTIGGAGRLGGGTYAAAITNDGALAYASSASQTNSGELSGTGVLTKNGTGALALGGAAANTYAGATTLAGSGQLILSKTGGAVAIPGSVSVDNTSSPYLRMTAHQQFGPASILSFVAASGNARVELQGTTQTLAGVSSAVANSVIQNSESGVGGNSLLILNSTGTYAYAGYLRNGSAGTLALTLTGGGTQTLSGANITYTGPTTVSQGVLTLGVGTVLSGSTPVTVATGSTLYLSGANGVGGNNQLVSSGAGIWNVSGTLFATSTSAHSVPGSIILNGGTMTGTQDCYATFGTYYVGQTMTITANGAGNTISSRQIGIGPGFTLRLSTPLAADSLTVSAVVLNQSTAGHLAKSGAGTVTLTASNTYSGSTMISNGVLALAGTASIGNSAQILVAAGATFDVAARPGYELKSGQILYGRGTVTGDVVTAAGAQIRPDGLNSVNTLTFQSALGLNAGSTNWFDLTGALGVGGGTNDLVAVAGVLEPSNSVIQVNPLQPLVNGAYTLFTYTGTNATIFNTNVLGNVTLKTWTLDQSVTGRVDLIVSGSYGNLRWNPITSSNWDFIGTNWFDMTALTTNKFLTSDNVLFDDNGAYSNGVNLAAAVAPSSVAINSASNYSITGTGKISGLTGLTKDGTGALTLGGVNDYTGATIISNGTLLLSGGSAIVDAGEVILADAAGAVLSLANNETLGRLSGGGVAGGGVNLGTNTLTIGGSSNGLFAGVLTGIAGGLTKAGTGTQTLSGASTYAGATTLNGGTLALSGGNDRLPAGTTLSFSGAGLLDLGIVTQTVSTFAMVNNITGRIGGSGGALTITNASTIYIGNGPGVNQTLMVAGVTVGIAPELRIGRSASSSGSAGVGTLRVDGATVNAANIFLGEATYTGGSFAPGAYGTIVVTNGTLKVNELYIGTINRANSFGDSLVQLDGGGTIYAKYIRQGGSFTPGGRTLAWNDGTIRNYDTNTDLTIFNELTAFTLAATGSHTFNISSGRTGTVNQVISGAGSLTKLGPGTLTFSVAATYTGGTTVSNGTLNLSGLGGSLAATGGGIFSPGAGVAGATVTALNLDTGGVYRVDITNLATSAGSGWDLLTASGAINLTATPASPAVVRLTCGISSLPGFGFLTDASWKIADGASISGFDASALTVDTSAFAPVLFGGTFSVSNDVANADLYLVFTHNPAAPTSFAWDGGADPDNRWTVNTNWTGDVLPASESKVAVRFAGSAGLVNTNDISGGFLMGNLVFDGGAGAFSLNGLPLTIYRSISNDSAVAQIVGNNLTLAGTVTAVLTSDLSLLGTVSGTNGLDKAGAGVLTLAGTNTYTGDTRILGGQLTLASGSGLAGSALDYGSYGGELSFGTLTSASIGGLKGGQALVLTNELGATVSTLTVGGNGRGALYSGVLSGAGGLAKIGAGTQTLSGVNAYLGSTTISGGQLALSGGDNRLPTNTVVTFAGNGSLNVGANSQKVANVTLNNGVTGAIVGNGGTLLVMGNNFAVGGTVHGTAQTLDLRGLGQFIFDGAGNTFLVGGQGGGNSTETGTLYLGDTNVIVASQFNIASVATDGPNVRNNTGTLELGSLNVVYASTIRIAMVDNVGTVRFKNGTINPALTLRGTGGGTSRVTTMFVSDHTSRYDNNSAGTLDLVTGTTGAGALDALIGTLYVASKSGLNDNGGNSTGNFRMGGGVLDATAIYLGYRSNGGSGTATATLTVEGGVIKAETLTIGHTTSGAVLGTLNINSGAVVRAQSIVAGSGTATRNFNWSSGTVGNLAGTNLTVNGLALNLIAGQPHVFDVETNLSATLGAGAPLTNAGDVVKSSAGTLVLLATNTYTGPTTIRAGALRIGGAGQLGTGSYAAAITNDSLFIYSSSAAQDLTGIMSGAGSVLQLGPGRLSFNGANTFTGDVTVSGGMLGGAGIIPGTVTVNAGGGVAPGNSISNITLGGLTLNVGSTNVFEFSTIPANDLIIVTNPGGLTLNGGSFLLYTDATASAWSSTGTYNLIQYAGGVGGSGPATLVVANPISGSGLAYTFRTNGTFVQLKIAGPGANPWTGGSTAPTANWSDAGNWAVGVPVDGDVLTFGANLQTVNTNDLAANLQFGLSFTNGAPAFTLEGNAINLVGDVMNLSANAQTINLPLVLDSGNRTFNTGIGTMTVNGSIGQANGTWGLTKTGGSALTLGGSAANTYGGATVLAATGQFILAKSGGAVAVPGNMVMASPGTRGILSTASNNQFSAGTVLIFPSTTPGDTRLELKGTTQTLAGIENTGFTGVYAAVQHSEFGAPAAISGTSTLILDVSGTNAYSFGAGNAVLRDQGGSVRVIKKGSGRQTFSGSGILFTGGMTVNSGEVVLASANVGRGAWTINNGGRVRLTAGNAIDSMGAITINEGGTMTDAITAHIIINPFTMNGGTLGASAAGNGTFGNFVLGNSMTVGGTTTSVVEADFRMGAQVTRTITVADTPADIDLFFKGKVSHLEGQTWGYMRKLGAGTMAFSNANNNVGSITIDDGRVLYIDRMTNPGNVTGHVNNAVLEANIGAGLTSTYAGTISGTGTFVKTGSGVLSLPTVCTYRGPTLLSGGTLRLTTILALSSNTAVTMADLTTLEIGSNRQAVAALNMAPSVTATSTLNIAGNGVSLPGWIAVTNVNGLSVTGTVVVNVSVALPPSGTTNTIISYAGTMGGAGSFVLGTLPIPGAIAYVTNDTAAGRVQLVVVESGTLRWVGSPTNTWDLSGVTNWVLLSDGNPAVFTNLNPVLFDDSALDFSVNSTGTVTPSRVTVNASSNYTFSGGTVAATLDLQVVGAGTTTMANVQSFTGTYVTNGTLSIGAGGASGSLAGPINNNGFLIHNRSDNASLTQVISGTGSFLKQGGGTLTFSGANTFAGSSTISTGTLVLQSETSGQLGSGLVSVSNGAVLWMQPGSTANIYNFTNSFLLDGGTVRGEDGSQRLGTGVGATITIGPAGGTVQATWGTRDVYLDGLLTGTAGLTLSHGTSVGSAATIHVGNASNPYSGAVSVGGGAGITLRLDQPTALQYASVNLTSSGTLLLSSLSGARITGLSGAAGTVKPTAAAGTYTLTINASNSFSFGGTLTNNTGILALLKTGSGTQTLSGVNGFSGGTIISNGTLTVNSTIGTGNVQVATNGRLAGIGTVGVVTNAGQVAAGEAFPETLVAATYKALPGSSTAFDLAGVLTAGTDYDQLIVTGAAALDGTLVVATNSGFAPANGNSFTLITATNITGTFASTNLPPLGPYLYWNVQYNPSTVMLVVTQAPALFGYDLWAQVITNASDRADQSDPDNDGYANLWEYSQGTDPTNSADGLKVLMVKTNGVFALKFNVVTSAVDLVYHVEAAYGLTNNATWDCIASNYLAQGWTGDAAVTSTNAGPVVQSFAEDNDPFAARRGMRLRIERP